MKYDELRPRSLQEYVGQEAIKTQLSAAIFSAKARKAPLPHVLLSGPPGLGKTSLALIIASSMGWSLTDLIGSTAGNPTQLSKRFLSYPQKTVLFIDEIHSLRKPVQEILYPVLEDNRLLYKVGSAQAEIELPPLTVIGATTDQWKLARPFIDRFQLQFELKFYTPKELAILGKGTAKKLGIGIQGPAIGVVAQRARGTPRILISLMKWIRDFELYQRPARLDAEFVESVLWGQLKVDSLGLKPIDRNYLRRLDTQVPRGLDMVSSSMRQASGTIETNIEPYLLYTGLITRVPGGRLLTEKGENHLAEVRRIRRGRKSV